MAHNNEDKKDNITSNPTLSFHPTTSTSRPNLHNNTFSSKIAETFLTAGHAFQKLGDLTVGLNAVNVDHEENRWTEKDIDNLRDAITRFANELDNISGSLLTRSKKMIRTDIKRRTLQMGTEIGGATLSGGRTILKPVSQTDPYLQQSVLSLNPATSKSSLATTSSISTSLNNIEQKPSTSGNQNALESRLTPANGATSSVSSSSPSTSAISTSLTSSASHLKHPVIKKVYVNSGNQPLAALRRQAAPIYRNQTPSISSGNIRLIGQNINPGRKLLISQNNYVRVVAPQDTDRQRPLAVSGRGRFQLPNGFANEEIVYTSAGPQDTRNMKRPLTESSQVPSKAPKLETAET
uniref:WASP family protein member n=2 Tax=Bursaphelenchus xylophilus TaxID=6326 RepID=A0A1I7RR87_BURXY